MENLPSLRSFSFFTELSEIGRRTAPSLLTMVPGLTGWQDQDGRHTSETGLVILTFLSTLSYYLETTGFHTIEFTTILIQSI